MLHVHNGVWVKHHITDFHMIKCKERRYHLDQLGYFPLKLNLQFLRTVMIWKLEVQNLHLTKINFLDYS